MKRSFRIMNPCMKRSLSLIVENALEVHMRFMIYEVYEVLVQRLPFAMGSHCIR